MQYDIKKKFPFTINNPEDAKRALALMEKILDPINCETLQRRPLYSFEFRIGNIHCVGKDKNEFLREIYGQTDFYLYQMLCHAYSAIEQDIIASLSLVKYETWELKISSPSKDTLIVLERSYNTAADEITNPQNKSVAIGTYIDQSQHVSISGETNNAVIGNNNTVTSSNQSAGEKSSFWKSVMESLTANFIWWLIGIVAALVVLAISFFKVK